MAQQNSSEEIDLGYLFGKLNSLLKGFVRGLFSILEFFKKYYIVVIVLVLVGFAYGYYKDSVAVKSYTNELLVIPNFESVDYLYDKVDAINLKIAAGDSIYLKHILDTNFRKIKSIEVEPVTDVYNFISKSRENIDIFRIIAEKQDFSDYLEDVAISKYFKYHRLKISVQGKKSSEKIVNDFITFLNENEHFNEYKKAFAETKDFEIKEHYNMVTQLDSLIKTSTSISKSNTSVAVSNNSDQHYLIERKRLILEDIYSLKMEQIDYANPIKVVNADYNLEIKQFLAISNKIKYPIYLLMLFFLTFLIFNLFKNLKKYANSN